MMIMTDEPRKQTSVKIEQLYVHFFSADYLNILRNLSCIQVQLIVEIIQANALSI